MSGKETHMCQIVITEKSNPRHIENWLDADLSEKEVIVMGDTHDETVRQCVSLAEERKLTISTR